MQPHAVVVVSAVDAAPMDRPTLGLNVWHADVATRCHLGNSTASSVFDSTRGSLVEEVAWNLFVDADYPQQYAVVVGDSDDLDAVAAAAWLCAPRDQRVAAFVDRGADEAVARLAALLNERQRFVADHGASTMGRELLALEAAVGSDLPLSSKVALLQGYLGITCPKRFQFALAPWLAQVQDGGPSEATVISFTVVRYDHAA